MHLVAVTSITEELLKRHSSWKVLGDFELVLVLSVHAQMVVFLVFDGVSVLNTVSFHGTFECGVMHVLGGDWVLVADIILDVVHNFADWGGLKFLEI
tara:strand:+ start:343 stop:633 length:291 start_codon:yes stop_codon:yes gene_type:complete